MSRMPSPERMYEAVSARDSSFDGIFYTAVKTTGIFYRPVCPARTPKPENVEFFAEPSQALFAGYRPCLRCRPLERVQGLPDWIHAVLQLIEVNADRRVRDQDLRDIGLTPERVRRFFLRHYGMTFHAYARGRRLGQAFRKLREGQDVIEATDEAGFESTSGFREAFSRVFGESPSRNQRQVLTMRWISTPLGGMAAAATDEALAFLEFTDRRMFETQVRTLQKRFDAAALPGQNAVLEQIEAELLAYFAGELREFRTPIVYPGTPFQEEVWARLLQIPYGELLSYGQMARDLNRPDAHRAVGKANGDNRLAIIIPCHRVVKSDGTLCGYGGGLWRKQRLIELESGQTKLL